MARTPASVQPELGQQLPSRQRRRSASTCKAAAGSWLARRASRSWGLDTVAFFATQRRPPEGPAPRRPAPPVPERRNSRWPSCAAGCTPHTRPQLHPLIRAPLRVDGAPGRGPLRRRPADPPPPRPAEVAARTRPCSRAAQRLWGREQSARIRRRVLLLGRGDAEPLCTRAAKAGRRAGGAGQGPPAGQSGGTALARRTGRAVSPARHHSISAGPSPARPASPSP